MVLSRRLGRCKVGSSLPEDLSLLFVLVVKIAIYVASKHPDHPGGVRREATDACSLQLAVDPRI